jgi:uncharacterized membrane protein
MDSAYLLDWFNLLLRWAHVVVAIAWIGSSFYFVFLDSNLTAPQDPALKEKGVGGELWAVHGGGFYNPQKYMVAPKQLPNNLHWFYWESYATWLTGFALFTVLYLVNAGTFLVDKSVYSWSPSMAIAAALAFLLVFWLVYDRICCWCGEKSGAVQGDVLVGLWVLLSVTLATWLACQLFAGRAAFLLVGAMMATAMSANVLLWIIPGQRKVIAQMKAGLPVDAIHGQRGKQRSVHNTYFTLPVLVAMLSNHYGWLHQGPHNWLVLVLLMLAGALIRHSFVMRHKAHVMGQRTPWEYAVAGVLVLLGLAAALAPPKQPVPAANVPVANVPAAKVSTAQIQTVMQARCVLCHNAQVQQKGVALHTASLVQQHALAIYQQSVVLKLMPMNNATQITDEERLLIKQWFEAGAN